MYLTYDISQMSQGSPEKQPALKGAKEISVPGKMIDWEVGEFETGSGSKAYGVKINYINISGQLLSSIIEVPASAKNVLVHIHRLPEEYRSVLESAA